MSKEAAAPPGHRELMALLEAAERADPGPQLALVLDSLHVMLPAHFAAEESPGGLLDEAAAHPAFADALAGLQREHIELNEALRALRQDPASSERLAALSTALRAHEQREEALREQIEQGD